MTKGRVLEFKKRKKRGAQSRKKQGWGLKPKIIQDTDHHIELLNDFLDEF
jgi:hypothetical protein